MERRLARGREMEMEMGLDRERERERAMERKRQTERVLERGRDKEMASPTRHASPAPYLLTTKVEPADSISWVVPAASSRAMLFLPSG